GTFTYGNTGGVLYPVILAPFGGYPWDRVWTTWDAAAMDRFPSILASIQTGAIASTTAARIGWVFPTLRAVVIAFIVALFSIAHSRIKISRSCGSGSSHDEGSS